MKASYCQEEIDRQNPDKAEKGEKMEGMTKEEMQRFLIKEAQRGSAELEAYRNLMEILGIEFPIEKENAK